MTPPIEVWPASQLPFRSQVTIRDTKRKGFNGDLKSCELLEMVQYECGVQYPDRKQSVAECWPIIRLFRRCRDREGSFMVETTAWEGKGTGKNGGRPSWLSG